MIKCKQIGDSKTMKRLLRADGGYMEKILVYHGSNVEVSQPRILQNGFYKDFGYGFYCTKLEKQARRWAMSRKGATVVNRYTYTPNPELKTLTFAEMTEEWLDFVADCRQGIEHEYDIVEGPMADDQVWDYVDDFEAFWALVKFNHPTHQILFRTQDALETLLFEGSDSYGE